MQVRLGLPHHWNEAKQPDQPQQIQIPKPGAARREVGIDMWQTNKSDQSQNTKEPEFPHPHLRIPITRLNLSVTDGTLVISRIRHKTGACSSN